MLAYYLPFLRAVEMGDRTADEFGDSIERFPSASFTIASFEQFGLRVGMPNQLIDRIQRAEAGELTGLYDYVRSLLRNTPGIEEGVFRDGVTIVTAWDEALSLPDWGQSGDRFTFG
jgi:hypothetical protein